MRLGSERKRSQNIYLNKLIKKKKIRDDHIISIVNLNKNEALYFVPFFVCGKLLIKYPFYTFPHINMGIQNRRLNRGVFIHPIWNHHGCL